MSGRDWRSKRQHAETDCNVEHAQNIAATPTLDEKWKDNEKRTMVSIVSWSKTNVRLQPSFSLTLTTTKTTAALIRVRHFRYIGPIRARARADTNRTNRSSEFEKSGQRVACSNAEVEFVCRMNSKKKPPKWLCRGAKEKLLNDERDDDDPQNERKVGWSQPKSAQVIVEIVWLESDTMCRVRVRLGRWIRDSPRLIESVDH